MENFFRGGYLIPRVDLEWLPPGNVDMEGLVAFS